MIAAVFAALPLPFIKKYTQTHNYNWLIGAICSYIILIYAYSIVLVNNNISIVYPLLKILSVMLVFLFGIYFFNDRIDIKTAIGIILGMVSIYLLS